MMMGGFGGMGSWGLFGGLFGWVLTVGLLVGLVFLGAWLWRRFGTAAEGNGLWAHPPATRPPSALDILQARYARGELTREEFQMMLQDLA